MTKISVCMATYNGAQFIESQLNSIVSQLDLYDEIIISDDGSTDGTISIINAFADTRIKLIHNYNRRGPAGNFENALNHSSGQLIFLSDQDDIWFPEKVSKMSNLLIDNDLVLTDCEVINKKGDILHPSFFALRGSRRGFWRNMYRNSYIGCCMAFRREVLNYALPFPAHIFLHDWWIGLLVEVKGRIVLYEKPLIKYVRHGGNFSPTGEKGYDFSKQLANRLSLLWNVTKRLLA